MLIRFSVYDDILGSPTNHWNFLPVELYSIHVFQCLNLHRLLWRSQRIGCCLHMYSQNPFKRSEPLSWELPCQAWDSQEDRSSHILIQHHNANIILQCRDNKQQVFCGSFKIHLMWSIPPLIPSVCAQKMWFVSSLLLDAGKIRDEGLKNMLHTSYISCPQEPQIALLFFQNIYITVVPEGSREQQGCTKPGCVPATV